MHHRTQIICSGPFFLLTMPIILLLSFCKLFVLLVCVYWSVYNMPGSSYIYLLWSRSLPVIKPLIARQRPVSCHPSRRTPSPPAPHPCEPFRGFLKKHQHPHFGGFVKALGWWFGHETASVHRIMIICRGLTTRGGGRGLVIDRMRAYICIHKCILCASSWTRAPKASLTVCACAHSCCARIVCVCVCPGPRAPTDPHHIWSVGGGAASRTQLRVGVVCARVQQAAAAAGGSGTLGVVVAF